ncbi:hypothetical protein DL89DRAFT_164705 [Linderina pennispora]|uniref:Amino acid transporter transmembrane domain-containing protein n=1 Tax=Linderina pennispora TaxID=61395 RepID=A0A1Y1W945_9FUNG|nr:uncharacterized protein DL89DRAFT_164705 [Linderina pennispora]ORX69684.1 hypothetical protein DL89DRAFT_164705 [Linderina pennispora]
MPSSPTQPLLSSARVTYSATPEPAALTDSSDSPAAVHKKGSSVETFFHIVCITAGTGILQLPYALKEGGWIGAFYIVLAGMISSYTGNMLIRCLYCKQGTRLQSYSDVVEAALGRRGKQIVRTLKDFNLLGVVGIYIVLAGVNISTLLADSSAFVPSVQFWIAASAVLVWLVIVLAREIHDVFVLSFFGTLTTVVTVVIIMWIGIGDASRRKEVPPTKLVDGKMLPISLASICFSFGGNLNWPDLEASMESPKLWSKTLSVATAFIAFIYLCVAVIGYGAYGDHVMSPILLSLSKGLPVATANVMITAHVLLACPILLTAVFIEAERDLNIDAAHHSPAAERMYRVLFRTAMMAAIALCALFVSDFAKFVPILGAVAASMVVFVIPVVCYIILYREQCTFSPWEYAWCALIVCVGLMCLVIGTSEAIGNL